MMSNPTPELPEDILKVIEIKSEEYAEDAGYMPYGLKSLTAIKGYVAGATEYAAIALELRKALDRIVGISEVHGRSDCKWGDTNHNSASVAYGQNLLLEDVKHMASKALALFPVDKKKEDGE